MTTFASLLTSRLRTDPGQPLVTYYDDLTGERIELSVTTWANWVAKVSSLLIDELGLEKGQRIRIDLPTHWLSTVFLGAAWNSGLVVTDSDQTDAVVTGPAGLEAWGPRAAAIPVLACALKPLGVRFSDPLPVGVLDVGVEVWSQPDAFVAIDPPAASDPIIETDGAEVSQQTFWEAATASPARGRLLTEANPASPPAYASFSEPFANGGSVVLVSHAGPERLEQIASAERTTARF